LYVGYDGVEDFPERLADFIRRELDKLDDSSKAWNSSVSEGEKIKNVCGDDPFVVEEVRWLGYD
jgi:hypothetical protein